MNITRKLNWKHFKELMLQNQERFLQFQYAEGKQVDASYHIIEIKQALITSVDCGGVLNCWTEIIIQLWEPSEKEQERAMTVSKAVSIINIVEAKLDLDEEALVKIEYGNSEFDTQQMPIDSVEITDTDLLVKLMADITQCKANELCGKPQPVNESSICCTPASSCC